MVLKTVDLIVFHKTKTLDFKAPIQCRELYIRVNKFYQIWIKNKHVNIRCLEKHNNFNF